MIEIADVSKTYPMGDAEVRALRNVSLSIEEGEFVAIMGPSGSGKSTLLHLLGLLSVPDGGLYRLCNHRIPDLTEDELAALRNRTIGFVFQQFFLLPHADALENVGLPLIYADGCVGARRAADRLASVGLGDRLRHRPNQLSGGQQQRVAIARALVNEPRLLLADEPTGNLDSDSARGIMELLLDLHRRGTTIVMVTHEPDVARYADRQIRMLDGRVQHDSGRSPGTLRMTAPDSGATARKTGATPLGRSPGRLGLAVRRGRTFLSLAWRSILANSVRSALSAIGVMVGTFAVIVTIALVIGARDSIQWHLQSMGTNLLVLGRGRSSTVGGAAEFGSATRFDFEDARLIRENVPGVKAVSAMVRGRLPATAGGRSWPAKIVGVEPEFAAMAGRHPQEGRFFTADEAARSERLALLGPTPARELFGAADPLGETMQIGRLSFRIIGLLPERGSSPWADEDDLVVVPATTAMRRLLGQIYLDDFHIEVTDASRMQEVQNRIRDLLLLRRRLGPDSQDLLRFRNVVRIQQSVTAIAETLSWLITSVALVVLVVGGIGIMNIMLVSVTERTREIGIRKTVGARRKDILLQFLIEALVLSLLGGIAGVALGWLAMHVITAMGWPVVVSWPTALLALAFSGLVGVLFGIWPARQAAKQCPIDALRHE